MKIINSPIELQNLLLNEKKSHSIGFVPTMGALHEGHSELVRFAKKENDIVVVSIFVNPTQFNNPDDFEKYPNTLDKDRILLEEENIQYLFLPNADQIYSDQFNYSISEKEKNSVLCGTSRPGHFSGVLTVVLKLLNIVQPHKMYLGEKDYQQLEILRGMVQAFFIPVEICPVPTVRDPFGLALSSRNARLNEEGLLKARVFASILKKSKNIEDAKTTLIKNKIEVDYIEELWGRRFGAVFINGVRLIDNVAL